VPLFDKLDLVTVQNKPCNRQMRQQQTIRRL